MVWGYMNGRPDGVNDRAVALVYLLHRQGLKPELIERGMAKVYGAKVDAKEIIRCLPYYLGQVKGYAPNDEVLDIKLMLSGDIP